MKITFEIKNFAEVKKSLEDRKFAVMKVAAMAINRAATHARKEIRMMAKQEYTMPPMKVQKNIEIKKANMRYLQAEIVVSAKTLPMIAFRTKGTGRPRGTGVTTLSSRKKVRGKIIPVQVMIKQSSGYRTFKNAFKARGRYGEGIFVRIGTARGPIKALQGPSVAGIVKNTANWQKIQASTDKVLQREFDLGIQNALDKGRVAESE